MNQGTLDRRAAVATLLKDRGDLLVVTGLGSPSYDCFAAGDDPLNYYLWAAMGSACTVGFGLAMTQRERPVLVVTGDGEMLMGLTALTTIGARRPANLAICVLDNERYTETGRQATATGLGTDLAAVASACGFPKTATLRTADEATRLGELLLRTPGPVMAVAKVIDETLPMVVPPRDGGYLKTRFRIGLLGEKAATQP
jgi:thiamine pyrophosphate-dependent acetolactate synthase large subunit-like protein